MIWLVYLLTCCLLVNLLTNPFPQFYTQGLKCHTEKLRCLENFFHGTETSYVWNWKDFEVILVELNRPNWNVQHVNALWWHFSFTPEWNWNVTVLRKGRFSSETEMSWNWIVGDSHDGLSAEFYVTKRELITCYQIICCTQLLGNMWIRPQ